MLLEHFFGTASMEVRWLADRPSQRVELLGKEPNPLG
jgi:hypothetical protein